jgi:hypothetical protein
MDEDSAVISNYLFRGIEYVVTMQISGDTVTLEVEDKLTADQWRGTFDANCKYLYQVNRLFLHAIKSFRIQISVKLIVASGYDELLQLKSS